MFATRRLARTLAAGAAGATLVRTLHSHSQRAGQADEHHGGPPATALDTLSYKGTYIGQLTPPLPREGADATTTGAVLRDVSGISWQRGAYGGWWLRLGAGTKMPSTEQLSAALDEATMRATAAKAAVYVGVQELSAEPGVTAMLRSHGFSYHHFSPNERQPTAAAGGSGLGPGEHVYYRWMGDPSHDMVPCYATSIEGVGALLLSPDEKKVLLVWEYGNWKPVSGAVDAGESMLYTAAREASEEAGVVLDRTFAPAYVGGWQRPRARDDIVNDNFRAFVVKAASEDFTVDGNEIAAARWFDLAALAQFYQDASRPRPWEQRSVPLPAALAERHGISEKQRKMSTFALAWLDTYTSGL